MLGDGVDRVAATHNPAHTNKDNQAHRTKYERDNHRENDLTGQFALLKYQATHLQGYPNNGHRNPH